MKRLFEVIAHKDHQPFYKNCKDNELDAILIAWELRMKGYEDVRIVKQEW